MKQFPTVKLSVANDAKHILVTLSKLRGALPNQLVPSRDLR